ncbi:MAG: aminoacyl-tRNA hydrolase [Phycisphaeraceae bacterium]|nr:aminoacyl-tRNA hydrolase [Phycisphaeraceae bacterium]
MDAFMVVGLGNPGLKYKNTRHNIGFDVIDRLAERFHVDVRQKKFGARFGTVDLEDKKLILLKPWQYMNLSGQAVATAVGFYKLDLKRVMVVIDDMALEPGSVRLRAKGSAGGHNGLSDIVAKLGTNQVARCRVGIGRDQSGWDVDHVLGRPSKAEQALLDPAIDQAQEAVLCWLSDGIDLAMTRYNASTL